MLLLPHKRCTEHRSGTKCTTKGAQVTDTASEAGVWGEYKYASISTSLKQGCLPRSNLPYVFRNLLRMTQTKEQEPYSHPWKQEGRRAIRDGLALQQESTMNSQQGFWTAATSDSAAAPGWVKATKTLQHPSQDLHLHMLLLQASSQGCFRDGWECNTAACGVWTAFTITSQLKSSLFHTPSKLVDSRPILACISLKDDAQLQVTAIMGACNF